MTPCLDLVVEAPKSRPHAPAGDRHRHSRDWTLIEGPCADTQAQADAAASSREVALHDRESEVLMKEAIASDERASSSQPSPPKSTPALVQYGPETHTIEVSASHMLLALVLAFCLAGPLAWAFVRYWLFAL
jgi:hypothetical protein